MKKTKFTHLKFLPSALLLFMFHSSFAQITLVPNATGIIGGFVLTNNHPVITTSSGVFYTTNGTFTSTISNSVLINKDSSNAGFYKGQMFFGGFNTAHHQELWATDGASARLVKDINTSGYADIFNFFVFNALLYFTADDGVHGYELWVTDGTTANTHIVTDINGTAAGSITDNTPFLLNGSYVLFAASGPNSSFGLYKLTSAGVTVVKNNFVSGIDLGLLAGAAIVGNKCVFTTDYGEALVGDEQLWITDGTTAGTTMLADFGAGTADAFYTEPTYLNGEILFNGYNASTGVELWSTDGTAAHTALLKDINSAAGGSSQPALYTSVILKNKLYFSATTNANGTELWSTDGTAVGTTLLKDINPGTKDASPSLLPNIGEEQTIIKGNNFDNIDFRNFYTTYKGKLYFTANDGTNGIQLWSSDGSLAGTQIVKIINSKGDAFDEEGSDAYYTTTGIYFTAMDGSKGNEPWTTDGTSTGTNLVYDLNTGSGSSNPEYQFIYDNQLYFAAQGNGTDTQLYKINMPLNILPLTLLNFNVVKENNTAKLNWQTSNEINTSYFNVQRSTDGRSFGNINKIAAKGSNKVNNDYTYIDDISQVHGDLLYYRLQEVDNDGKFNYSGIKIIELNKNSSLFTIFPNPAKDYINISSSGSIANAQISVTDMNGKTLYAAKQTFTANQQIKIPASQFAKQVLIVTINTSNGKQEFKVVKE